MTHPGLAVAVLVGVGLGTLLYYFLSENQHSYGAAEPRRTSRPDRELWTLQTTRNGERRRSSRTDRRDDICVICTEQVAQSGISLQPCMHVFHTKCIKTWKNQGPSGSSSLCPMCREPYRPSF